MIRPLLRLAIVVLLATVASGCYVATIETGATPGDTTIERPWAHGWLWGLVPPSVTDARQKCTSGVAIVETQHSFLNQLASGLTWGIYTPIQITVTCAKADMARLAEGDETVRVEGVTIDGFVDAMQVAADRTVARQQPVYVAWK